MKKLINKFTKADDFNGNIAYVDYNNKKYYINRHGEVIQIKETGNLLPFCQKRITTLSNCVPEEENGKFGIINVKTREIIIPYEYDFCWFFMEYGLAEVRKNGKCGFINYENEIVIPIEYDRVGIFGFQSGLCLVEKDSKCGFIDKNNNLVIPLKYGPNSSEFCEGIACVEVLAQSGNYYKYITKDGKDAF